MKIYLKKIIQKPKRSTDLFTKTPQFKSLFQISKYRPKQQKFSTLLKIFKINK